ncbi:MAG: hypothetical protein ACT4QG_05785 [Sporichthyaceae bacterium]
MLNLAHRLVHAGPTAVNRGLIAVFTVIGTFLLGHTWLDSRSVSSDLHNTIAPELSSAAADPAVEALLRRTGDLTEEFAAGLLPLGTAWGSAADSTAAAAVSAEEISRHTRTSAESFSRLAVTAADLRAFSEDLAPVVVAMVADTGDIAGNLGRAEQEARASARLLADALRRIDGLGSDTRTLRAQIAQIEAILGRVEANGKRIAAARPLDCPKTLRACLS